MRYLPLTSDDRRAMLGAIGVKSIEDLFVDVPTSARQAKPLDLPPHAGELEVERELAALAAKNLAAGQAKASFVGAGAYRHHVPAAVDHLIQRGEFLTAYTPYQPEISQGTLQMLFEFQSQVALVTGMEVANASMYDGATSAAEAVLMARRTVKREKVVISAAVHPHYRETIETFARYSDGEIAVNAPDPTQDENLEALIDDQTACLVVQNPDVFGRLRDLTPLARACQAKGALLIAVVTEVVSLGAITPPGEMGADIVVAEGQSIGNGLNFGGPYVGLFATREKYIRQMPGRLAGQTVDADGKRGFVLTLSTREQHIRREKATSNICTNAGLCALAFTIHMSLLGSEGLRQLARLNHAKAVQLAEKLAVVPGAKVLNQSFFNEFTLRLPKPAAPVVEKLAADGILAGVPASRLYPGVNALANDLLIAVTETATEAQMDALVAALKGAV
ncbi:MAG TPA: aminomethyl-transferring glycine dehydrogenase subunit GcvPA [Alphaproteobacteria bacterium]|nr:aminomethyl-transferring glycine dehydrogenase subunit GcvPA [Alphaproteobacteria bacterium]